MSKEGGFMYKDKKNLPVQIVMGIGWCMLALWGLVCFNRYVLMSLPLQARLVLSINMYLCMAIGPLVVMLIAGDTWTDYLFSREKIGGQILVATFFRPWSSLFWWESQSAQPCPWCLHCRFS